LANLGYMISDQTVGNVLQRHALPPAAERKRTTTWPVFIRTHLALLAGTDFFTAEVLTLRGLVTYYVLFFIHLESRRVDIAGITIHPGELWMKQVARNVTMEGCGALRDCRYLRMIGTQNTPSHSGRSLRQVGLNRSRCQRVVRT
jgi:putative transposase